MIQVKGCLLQVIILMIKMQLEEPIFLEGSEGWNQFLQKVTLFCNKHGVEVPTMEGNYVPFGRSRRFVQNQTNDDHFRREVYIGVIDKISQELDSRFDEVNMELLSCMSALNPSNSFASFYAQKVRRLAEFYPKTFLALIWLG